MAKPTQSDPKPSTPPAGGDQPPPAGQPTASTNDAPPKSDEDARVAQQRQSALEQSLQQASERMSNAEARANALEGDLAKEKGLRQAAEAKVLDLELQLARANTAAANAGDAIEGLPKGAFQVRESVTISSLARGSNAARRAHPKKGDVLLVGSDDDVDALQRELGGRAVVHRVDKDTVQDLKKSGFLLG